MAYIVPADIDSLIGLFVSTCPSSISFVHPLSVYLGVEGFNISAMFLEPGLHNPGVKTTKLDTRSWSGVHMGFIKIN